MQASCPKLKVGALSNYYSKYDLEDSLPCPHCIVRLFVEIEQAPLNVSKSNIISRIPLKGLSLT